MDLVFEKLCDVASLDAELVSAGLVRGSRFFGVSSDAALGRVVVHLADDATDEEQTTASNTVTAHDLVADARNAALDRLYETCTAYIYDHYGAPQQASLTAMLVQAAAMGYTNRLAYVGAALAWVESVTAYYYQRKDALVAAMTVDGIAAVAWDFPANFDASDPRVTIRSAQNMTN